ncbi:hypothetical protein HRI_003942500 [Hibiscus trionum]|uniref:RING-type domain-containing protein n=1 Tax=Hibiscus trionum TaxID=183268 RepID=A0A9W7IUA3_HIBTR|nr:hypothetical protein HRI_003942500 [Hibiscus trionum]
MAVQAQPCYEIMDLPLPVLPSFEPGFSLPEFPFQQNAQSLTSMAVPQPLDVQLEIQRQELDCFLHLQNERFRHELREQRQQQLGILLRNIETKAVFLMRRKEEDLARATKKRMELESCLRRVEMESQSWQRLAEANESMAMDLSKRLVVERSSAEDEGSIFCGLCNKEQQERDTKMVCKHCNSGSSCIVFLPCRHLCSCQSCEPLLVSCPVCKSVKEGSIKVFGF